jgi:hypothetical protein
MPEIAECPGLVGDECRLICFLQRAALRIEVGVSEPASDYRDINTGGHQMNGRLCAETDAE